MKLKHPLFPIPPPAPLLLIQLSNLFPAHYSTLSSVEHNWSLGNLGRQDTNKTVSNVFSVFSDKWNYTNNDLSLSNSAGSERLFSCNSPSSSG